MARGLKEWSRAVSRVSFARLPADSPARVRESHPVRWGNLRRLDPVDAEWGYGRGTPVDRWHLARFFERYGLDVHGRVLEVASPMYSAEHLDRVERLDILDIDPENQQATIVVDLDDAGSLPTAAFDCVICTQTLQYVQDLDTALANLWQSLAPGGVLLLSIPAIAKRDHKAAMVDRWRLMPAGLATLVERACPWSETEVFGAGNVLVAVAALWGLSAEELTTDELGADHGDFPVLSLARVRKPYELAWQQPVTA